MVSHLSGLPTVLKCSSALCGLELHPAVRIIPVLVTIILTRRKEQDEGVNKFVEFVSASQTPHPIPSKQTIPNGIHATDDDKPHLKALEIHNSVTDKGTFGSDSSSPLSSPPPLDESEDWEFPFSDSSSPLSPPPEIIETPPWLSRSES